MMLQIKIFFTCCIILQSSLVSADKESKIVGGTDVAEGQFTFMVSIEHNGLLGWGHVCGGTILNENYVLTSAGCVDGIKEKNLRIIAGEYKRNQDESYEEHRNITTVVVHEFYDSITNTNDIALLLVDSPMTESLQQVSFVDIPTDPSTQTVTPGEICIFLGWGSHSSGGLLQRTLQEVTITAISDSTCRTQYDFTQIGDSMLCTFVDGGIASPCDGDMGGPLICNGVQSGIFSWQNSCGDPNYSTVYTELIYYLDWIADHSA